MALYRKYRPASFSEVVGQDQVTVPLSTALDSGRINHAYLFSGPRGCGKTSSARILARSLNCVNGPTSTPCGVCDSCVSLAPGGPGNLDVMELDAASHNGVDDMRELRERAIYAPAESRYRVFIIDEAHMISNAGSNALLKVVEEPPEHLIFIFATTEPEKVIGTIRSRTHHYPFRLVAPPDMRGLIERIIAEEHVTVDPAVFPLVIRAGGGSPRDTLSILDQLLAGAGPEGLSYEAALPLLGVTDTSLLDDAIRALGTNDAGALFSLVGSVVDSGHEPRRFTEDLLDRLRDLMILQSVPTAVTQGLIDVPADQATALGEQAALFTGNQLPRLAGILNDCLKDMRGATSQRLMLEIACASMLVEEVSAPMKLEKPKVEKLKAEKPKPKAEKPQPVVEQPAPAPEPDLLATVRAEWAKIRREIGQRNRVASIMVAEAKVLGLRGDTLVLGHNTGALAQRINAPSNNKDIVHVLNDRYRQHWTVECVVGTDPQAQGFDTPTPQSPVWQPQLKSQPKPRHQPAPAPEPPLPPEPEPEDLPPEPEPEPEPTPAPAPPTQEEEERMMVDQQAQEPGQRDRRDATEVAIDLLMAELDARRA